MHLPRHVLLEEADSCPFFPGNLCSSMVYYMLSVCVCVFSRAEKHTKAHLFHINSVEYTWGSSLQMITPFQ